MSWKTGRDALHHATHTAHSSWGKWWLSSHVKAGHLISYAIQLQSLNIYTFIVKLSADSGLQRVFKFESCFLCLNTRPVLSWPGKLVSGSEELIQTARSWSMWPATAPIHASHMRLCTWCLFGSMRRCPIAWGLLPMSYWVKRVNEKEEGKMVRMLSRRRYQYKQKAYTRCTVWSLSLVTKDTI